MTPEIQEQLDMLALQVELANAAAADLGRQFNAEREAHAATRCRLEEAMAYIRTLESARVYT